MPAAQPPRASRRLQRVVGRFVQCAAGVQSGVRGERNSATVSAIAGLLVVGVPDIGKMGPGAAIAIGAVVVSPLMILPIMIGALGRRLVPKKQEHVRSSPGFSRLGELVTRRPWARSPPASRCCSYSRRPVTQLRLGQTDDGNKAESLTQRDAYEGGALND